MSATYLVGAEVVFAERPVGPEVHHVPLLHDEGCVEQLEGVGRRAVDGGADCDASLALQQPSSLSVACWELAHAGAAVKGGTDGAVLLAL